MRKPNGFRFLVFIIAPIKTQDNRICLFKVNLADLFGVRCCHNDYIFVIRNGALLWTFTTLRKPYFFLLFQFLFFYNGSMTHDHLCEISFSFEWFLCVPGSNGFYSLTHFYFEQKEWTKFNWYVRSSLIKENVLYFYVFLHFAVCSK